MYGREEQKIWSSLVAKMHILQYYKSTSAICDRIYCRMRAKYIPKVFRGFGSTYDFGTPLRYQDIVTILTLHAEDARGECRDFVQNRQKARPAKKDLNDAWTS